MLNHFFIEREVLNRTNMLIDAIYDIKLWLSNQIRDKSDELNEPVPEQLKKYMVKQKQEVELAKSFFCKYCNKNFDDGRKLGGHISRSHPFAKYSSRSEIEMEEDSNENDSIQFKSYKKSSNSLKNHHDAFQKKKVHMHLQNSKNDRGLKKQNHPIIKAEKEKKAEYQFLKNSSVLIKNQINRDSEQDKIDEEAYDNSSDGNESLQSSLINEQSIVKGQIFYQQDEIEEPPKTKKIKKEKIPKKKSSNHPDFESRLTRKASNSSKAEIPKKLKNLGRKRSSKEY